MIRYKYLTNRCDFHEIRKEERVMSNTNTEKERMSIIDSNDIQEITAEEMEELLSEVDQEIENEKNSGK